MYTISHKMCDIHYDVVTLHKRSRLSLSQTTRPLVGVERLCRLCLSIAGNISYFGLCPRGALLFHPSEKSLLEPVAAQRLLAVGVAFL